MSSRETGRVERTIDLMATPDAVWAQLADDARLGAWLGGEAQLEVRPGGRGRFRLDEEEAREALVHEVEPGRRLVFSWWPLGDRGNRRMSEATMVTITIDGLGDGSRLRLVESVVAPPSASGSPTSALAGARP